jgi:hypothetical protein
MVKKMRITSKVLAVPDPPKVRLYIGFPPELEPDPNARQMMEPPDVLLIEQDKDGNGFFLVRYTAAGVFAGDTWHLNLDDAKHQADFEFEGLIRPWISVPSDVNDVVRYALEQPF